MLIKQRKYQEAYEVALEMKYEKDKRKLTQDSKEILDAFIKA